MPSFFRTIDRATHVWSNALFNSSLCCRLAGGGDDQVISPSDPEVGTGQTLDVKAQSVVERTAQRCSAQPLAWSVRRFSVAV